MIQSESISERTSVKVQGKDVDLPTWLVKEASERSIEKAITLLSTEKMTKMTKYKESYFSKIKGSKGGKYNVRVLAFEDKDKRPETMECDCKHGVAVKQYGVKGLCYHKIAVVLRVRNCPQDFLSRIQNYEDDFSLED